MKVFMLSNPAAIHTQRWVSALAKRGVEIMLYSFYPCEKVDYYRGIKHVQVKSFWQSRDSKGIKGFILVKLFIYYRALIKDIRNSIQIFHPDIVHAHYLSDNGLFVALSRVESFGVAVVEAMAVGCPVVVSDAPGFTEIVKSGESGLIVERENPQQASEAMETLVNDETLRVTLAQNGEKRVRELYDWDKNVEDMIEIYQEIVEERNV